jgi:hypothetical protein
MSGRNSVSTTEVRLAKAHAIATVMDDAPAPPDASFRA